MRYDLVFLVLAVRRRSVVSFRRRRRPRTELVGRTLNAVRSACVNRSARWRSCRVFINAGRRRSRLPPKSAITAGITVGARGAFSNDVQRSDIVGTQAVMNTDDEDLKALALFLDAEVQDNPVVAQLTTVDDGPGNFSNSNRTQVYLQR